MKRQRFTRRQFNRADCIDGPRPCFVLSCRHNLGREILDGHKALGLRASDEDLDAAAELAIAFLASSAESCALDIVEKHPDGLDAGDVAKLLGITPRQVNRIETGERVLSAFAPLRDDHVRNPASSCTRESESPLERFRRRVAATGLPTDPRSSPLEGVAFPGVDMFKPPFYAPLASVAADPVDGSFLPRTSADVMRAAAGSAMPAPPAPAAAAAAASRAAFDTHLARFCRIAGITAEQLKKHAPTRMLVVPDLRAIVEATEKRGA